MRFLFDNNLSIDLAHGLRELRRSFDEEIIHLKDRYPENISDIEYLQDLIGEGGWSVISADRFKKNAAERQAIRHPRIKVFLINPSFHKLPSWRKTKTLINQWEDISKIASATSGGVFTVRIQGKISPYQPN